MRHGDVLHVDVLAFGLPIPSLKSAFNALTRWLAAHLGERSYYLVAVLLSAGILVDGLLLPLTAGMSKPTFDAVMRTRLAPRPPDPSIVIVDIDEASLAAMSAEHGRWPWPRAVLAEALDAIEAQGPQAVVFDILFADPDVLNPDSERVFNEAVARSQTSFFPWLRLDARNDALSQVRASMVPGAARVGQAGEDPTVALILPRFPAVLDSGRLGAVNALPDADGVVRRYRLYETAGDWRLPSLASRVADALGHPAPDGDPGEILLNWRGPPGSYRRVSFHELHADALRLEKRRAPDEFRGRIAIIGSSAPALFDAHASPMAALHPGAEILATAIDNRLAGDAYRAPGRRFGLFASLLLVWTLAFLLKRHGRALDPAPLTLGVQGVMAGLVWASLSFSRFYLDLTAPFAWGLVFFMAASLRARLREGVAARGEAPRPGAGGGGILLLLIVAPQAEGGRPRALPAALRARLVDAACGSRAGGSLFEFPRRGRSAVGEAFAGVLVLHWRVGEDLRAAAEAECAALEHALAGAPALRLLRYESSLDEEAGAGASAAAHREAVARVVLRALARLHARSDFPALPSESRHPERT